MSTDYQFHILRFDRLAGRRSVSKTSLESTPFLPPEFRESRKALQFKKFQNLKMKEKPGINPALDFDEFVSALQAAQRDALAATVTIDPAQVFDQLQRGIPKRYRQFQLQAVITGHNTFDTYSAAIRNALDAHFLLGMGTASEQADEHTRNEQTSVQTLASVATTRR